MSKNLYQKLVDIMSEMSTVEKKGHNKYSDYDYIRESDVSTKLQQILVKHNVFIFSSITSAETTSVTTKKGDPALLSSVNIEYTFVNADNPEERFSVMAAGDGTDTGDKAIYKAITGAHKYFVIRNFNLGSDEDAEKASPELSGGSAKTRGKQSGKVAQGSLYDAYDR